MSLFRSIFIKIIKILNYKMVNIFRKRCFIIILMERIKKGIDIRN